VRRARISELFDSLPRQKAESPSPTALPAVFIETHSIRREVLECQSLVTILKGESDNWMVRQSEFAPLDALSSASVPAMIAFLLSFEPLANHSFSLPIYSFIFLSFIFPKGTDAYIELLTSTTISHFAVFGLLSLRTIGSA
jgi:hypothetical protein